MENYSTYRENEILAKLWELGANPLDVMITGVTGAGKSTTLNSVFQKTVAKVGDGVDPETMELDSYLLSEDIRLWDTQKNRPDETLRCFLEEQAYSIQKRVIESTGVFIKKPVYYSALKGYNIDKLLDFIIDNIPKQMRRI